MGSNNGEPSLECRRKQHYRKIVQQRTAVIPHGLLNSSKTTRTWSCRNSNCGNYLLCQGKGGHHSRKVPHTALPEVANASLPVAAGTCTRGSFFRREVQIILQCRPKKIVGGGAGWGSKSAPTNSYRFLTLVNDTYVGTLMCMQFPYMHSMSRKG